MKIKRFGVAAIALAAAGVITLAGCTSGSPESTGEAGASTAVITVNNTEPQNPLIPTNTNEVGGGLVLQNIFAGLVYYDAEGAVHNDVAESIETDDAQTYTIKIRDGLTFTNGDPVNAESFVTAWNYGAALDNAQLSSYFFESHRGLQLRGERRGAVGPRGRRRPDLHRHAQRSPSRTSRCASATRRTSRCPSRRGRTSRRSVRTRSATARTCSTARAPGSTTSASAS